MTGQRSRTPGVVVIGIGYDRLDALSEYSRSSLASADLVCGGERHLACVPANGAEQLVIKAPLSSILDRIGEALRKDRMVVVLASGDPCCFGIGPLLANHIGRENVEIVPSVSSVQLLFARLGEAWQDARILSAHGRPIEPVIGPAIATSRSAILTDDVNTPAALARELLESGMEDCRAVVGERLGGPSERIVKCRLSELLERAFDPLSVLALFREDRAVRTPASGLPDTMYQHREGMITKAEVRAVCISQLALRRGDVVWDVGSGCGSVGIEAASFVDAGFVYAVESEARQIEHLRRNLKTFPGPVRIIHGEAPDVLSHLPDPDAAFIGGSGGRLDGIVRVVVDRLRPAGRLVATFVVLDHLLACQKHLEAAGWWTSVTQIAANRLGPMGRLEALNPVFVLSAVNERGSGSRAQ